MSDQFLVAPSLLSADFSNLGAEVKAVEAAGADLLHIDVMDGHFVPNITLRPPVIKALKAVAKKPLDVHLMISEPDKYVQAFAAAGASYLTIHVEASPAPEKTLAHIRRLGVKPGITLRPKTPIESILPFLNFADLVLIMTVEPGFGGQVFMPEQVKKINQVRAKLKTLNHDALIEVDGGINAETAKLCREADILVAGSYVFSRDYRLAIESLRAK